LDTLFDSERFWVRLVRILVTETAFALGVLDLARAAAGPHLGSDLSKRAAFPIGTVTSRLKRARQKVRKAFSREQ